VETQLQEVQIQLDAALSIQKKLEAQIAHLVSTDAEFQTVRDQLTAAQEKHKRLETKLHSYESTQIEYQTVKSQLLEAVESQKKLKAQLSRLIAREAELSKDLAEKKQIQEQLTSRVSDLLKTIANPEHGQLLDNANMARTSLEDKIEQLKVIDIPLLHSI